MSNCKRIFKYKKTILPDSAYISDNGVFNLVTLKQIKRTSVKTIYKIVNIGKILGIGDNPVICGLVDEQLTDFFNENNIPISLLKGRIGLKPIKESDYQYKEKIGMYEFGFPALEKPDSSLLNPKVPESVIKNTSKFINLEISPEFETQKTKKLDTPKLEIMKLNIPPSTPRLKKPIIKMPEITRIKQPEVVSVRLPGTPTVEQSEVQVNKPQSLYVQKVPSPKLKGFNLGNGITDVESLPNENIEKLTDFGFQGLIGKGKIVEVIDGGTYRIVIYVKMSDILEGNDTRLPFISKKTSYGFFTTITVKVFGIEAADKNTNHGAEGAKIMKDKFNYLNNIIYYRLGQPDEYSNSTIAEIYEDKEMRIPITPYILKHRYRGSPIAVEYCGGERMIPKSWYVNNY